MTVVKTFQKPQKWLDLELCESLYNHFNSVAPDFGASYKDPLPPFSTRYAGRLESILESVKLRSELQSLDVVDTAILYYYKLNVGHPFLNGNKRLSTHFCDIFLIIHFYWLSIPKDAMVKLAIGLESISPEEEHSILPALRELFVSGISDVEK